MHNNYQLQGLIVNERIEGYMREAEISRLVPDDAQPIRWRPTLFDTIWKLIVETVTIHIDRRRLRLPTSETGR
jgi:hypothetical protein